MEVTASVGLLFFKIIKFLIDIHSKDYFGRTPISWAAENGHMSVASLSLKKGADPVSKDNLGRTLLLWAKLQGYEVVVKLLQGGYIGI